MILIALVCNTKRTTLTYHIFEFTIIICITLHHCTTSSHMQYLSAMYLETLAATSYIWQKCTIRDINYWMEKCSAFLYTIGQAGRDVYNTMTLSEEEQDKIEVLFSKFESYCKPKQNVTIERYRFNTRVHTTKSPIRCVLIPLSSQWFSGEDSTDHQKPTD